LYHDKAEVEDTRRLSAEAAPRGASGNDSADERTPPYRGVGALESLPIIRQRESRGGARQETINHGRHVMAISIKKVTLWRTEVANQPGTLGQVLGPLAEAGANLQVVMGYRYPGNEKQAAIEVAPVSGRKLTAAANKAKLAASDIPTLLIQGDDAPGLGQAIAAALADAGINICFLVAQVIEGRFSAVVGFDDEAGAREANSLIKKAARKLAK
jgi:hypothetical protein